MQYVVVGKQFQVHRTLYYDICFVSQLLFLLLLLLRMVHMYYHGTVTVCNVVRYIALLSHSFVIVNCELNDE